MTDDNVASLPPYAALLGILVEREDGEQPLFRLPFHEGVGGREGFLHGGAIAGLLEIAAIGSLLATLAGEGDVHVRPINITVDFMRGGRERETFAAATILRIGTRIANVEAFAWQEGRDKLIATARMNLMLRRS